MDNDANKPREDHSRSQVPGVQHSSLHTQDSLKKNKKPENKKLPWEKWHRMLWLLLDIVSLREVDNIHRSSPLYVLWPSSEAGLIQQRLASIEHEIKEMQRTEQGRFGKGETGGWTPLSAAEVENLKWAPGNPISFPRLAVYPIDWSLWLKQEHGIWNI